MALPRTLWQVGGDQTANAAISAKAAQAAAVRGGTDGWTKQSRWSKKIWVKRRLVIHLQGSGSEEKMILFRTSQSFVAQALMTLWRQCRQIYVSLPYDAICYKNPQWATATGSPSHKAVNSETLTGENSIKIAHKLNQYEAKRGCSLQLLTSLRRTSVLDSLHYLWCIHT